MLQADMERTIARSYRRKTAMPNSIQRITPFVWFDSQAEEAAKFYVSIFKNSSIAAIARYGKAGAEASGRPEGSVMTVRFLIDGQEFVALNGGPHFKPTEAISFVVNCETQKEIDEFWENLSRGGHTDQCGWLKDKFGVSWQVVPAILGDLVSESDPERSDRVMRELLQMKKLDLETLKRA
jgi:predicted 3-demethylubiquinone-9 3-methyltransferase (glyoxalase superfamily)